MKAPTYVKVEVKDHRFDVVFGNDYVITIATKSVEELQYVAQIVKKLLGREAYARCPDLKYLKQGQYKHLKDEYYIEVWFGEDDEEVQAKDRFVRALFAELRKLGLEVKSKSKEKALYGIAYVYVFAK